MNFESQLFQYLENLKNNLRTQPMFLGGTGSWSGGIGGPPGGFIGYLPQTRVAYDFGESASNYTPASGMSLWDNLNHIRYRIQTLEDGGITPSGTSTTLIVEEDGTIVASGVYILNFVGATVTETSTGVADIEIIGGGGGDMYKSVYDTNDDGTVDSADTAVNVPWTGILDVPTTFPPETHDHDDRYYTETELSTEGQSSVHWGNLTNVPTLSGGGIEEAPIDGNTYGRQDGEWVTISGGGGTDTSAIHTDVASEIHALSEKIILVNDDEFIIEDSADSYNKKRVRASNLVVSGIDSDGYQTLTDQANITWDLTNGSAGVTLGGNRTISNPTNMAAGHFYFLQVIQDSTGGRTLGFGDSYKFPSNIKPTLSTFGGTADVLTFACDGTYLIYTGIMRNVTNADPTLSYTTNLLMWLRADVGVYSDNGTTLCQDGDTVYYWEDQGGNGNHAIQATQTNSPTFQLDVLNNRPAILFNGEDNHMVVTAMDGGDNVSFFIVIVPNDLEPCGLIDTTAGDVPPIRNDPAGNWDWYYYQPGTDITQPNMNPVLLEFIHTQSSGREVNYYRNGSLVSTNTDSTEDPTAWGDPRIGSNNDGSEGWYNGYIAEFLIYSEAVSSANRQTIETYLKAKYGIS